MNTFAVELSSSRAGLAVIGDGGVEAVSSWTQEHRSSGRLVEALSALLEEAAMGWEDIDFFSVGRGPGRYSSMRIALATVQALALPGNQPVFTLSSGEALAAELAAEREAEYFAICGDARRERLWYGLFRRCEQGLEQVGDWSLCESARLAECLPPGTMAASPDWSRLATGLDRRGVECIEWIPEDRYPSAAWVGRLALEGVRGGRSSEPLTPLYMHPPVFIPPRTGA